MKKALKVLFAINGVFVLGAHLLGPLYAVFVNQELGGTALIVSLSWAVFIISTLFFMLVAAKYGDRFKERELLLGMGFLIRAVCWGAYIFVTNIYGLLAVQVLLGLGEALGTPAFNALLAQHVNQKKAVREYSVWAIISRIAAAVATVVGGVVVTTIGFTPLFAIMMVLSIVAFIILIKQPRSLL